jgi:hypothetical protein
LSIGQQLPPPLPLPLPPPLLLPLPLPLPPPLLLPLPLAPPLLLPLAPPLLLPLAPLLLLPLAPLLLPLQLAPPLLLLALPLPLPPPPLLPLPLLPVLPLLPLRELPPLLDPVGKLPPSDTPESSLMNPFTGRLVEEHAVASNRELPVDTKRARTGLRVRMLRCESTRRALDRRPRARVFLRESEHSLRCGAPRFAGRTCGAPDRTASEADQRAGRPWASKASLVSSTRKRVIAGLSAPSLTELAPTRQEFAQGTLPT